MKEPINIGHPFLSKKDFLGMVERLRIELYLAGIPAYEDTKLEKAFVILKNRIQLLDKRERNKLKSANK